MSDGVGRSFVTTLLIVLAAAAALRTAWLTTDPPANSASGYLADERRAPGSPAVEPVQAATDPVAAIGVGIVWHDEGAWVHNARNRALWGAWRADEWNPVFVAPVFTALEYAAFRAFGVGTWQARTVPVASGLLAVVLLAAGLASIAGGRAAIIGACLLATNYVFVMWNRAALMESTMTAFIVASWAAYALAERRPSIGLLAGTAVVLAWFTKAAAAFFVAALVVDAMTTLVLWRSERLRRALGIDRPSRTAVRAAGWTVAGMAIAGSIALVAFVLPYWSEYQFYNWQMSVTRKPTYTLRSFLDRASWLPIIHDFFTRMWLVTTAAALSLAVIVGRWRLARPSERLLVLWILLGLAELIVHDAGNERRYVMLIPALVGLAALLLGSAGPVAPRSEDLGARARWLALPLVLFLAYLVLGGLARLAFIYEIRVENRHSAGVRLSAALAMIAGGLIAWRWQQVSSWLARQRMRTAGAIWITALVVAGDLAQYAQWARQRTSHNHDASIALGRVLPPGTLVHGKLANGLSLENAIRPVFVGREFGNYEDRKQRNDVRYILTYIEPYVGYEGRVITDVLDAYPDRRIIMTFDVAETTSGRDRAALIDKFGSRAPAPLAGRAHD
jgi:4-amino-4-deoxy-L-arabinose transferase-like glycosyltransferase